MTQNDITDTRCVMEPRKTLTPDQIANELFNRAKVLILDLSDETFNALDQSGKIMKDDFMEAKTKDIKDFSNNLSKTVKTSLLSYANPEDRIQAAQQWLAVAQACLEQNNYLCAQAIYSVLGMMDSIKNEKIYIGLANIFNDSDQYKEYQDAAKSKIEKGEAIIPVIAFMTGQIITSRAGANTSTLKANIEEDQTKKEKLHTQAKANMQKYEKLCKETSDVLQETKQILNLDDRKIESIPLPLLDDPVRTMLLPENKFTDGIFAKRAKNTTTLHTNVCIMDEKIDAAWATDFLNQISVEYDANIAAYEAKLKGAKSTIEMATGRQKKLANIIFYIRNRNEEQEVAILDKSAVQDQFDKLTTNVSVIEQYQADCQKNLDDLKRSREKNISIIKSAQEKVSNEQLNTNSLNDIIKIKNDLLNNPPNVPDCLTLFPKDISQADQAFLQKCSTKEGCILLDLEKISLSITESKTMIKINDIFTEGKQNKSDDSTVFSKIQILFKEDTNAKSVNSFTLFGNEPTKNDARFKLLRHAFLEANENEQIIPSQQSVNLTRFLIRQQKIEAIKKITAEMNDMRVEKGTSEIKNMAYKILISKIQKSDPDTCLAKVVLDLLSIDVIKLTSGSKTDKFIKNAQFDSMTINGMSGTVTTPKLAKSATSMTLQQVLTLQRGIGEIGTASSTKLLNGFLNEVNPSFAEEQKPANTLKR